ncbi:DUF6772 family protein [Roseomonas sp. CCTCC AB2023176]|uniref:DUF6772 family protein n=1 Tax=Roseomonas sp. CCTCC AB2023176 TaxID=3342640 RepID=UPI0035D778BC
MDADTLRRAAQMADPRLSRYEPMPRIICLDDFDRGFCGYTQLVGNYEHTLDSMHPEYAQHSAHMLSTAIGHDCGSHNAIDGTYSLKIASRAKRGARNVTIKRLTFRKRGPIRLEFYVTFKPEASDLRLSETDVRSFGFGYDLQGGDADGAENGRDDRVMPHWRFLNALDGEHVQKWQYKAETTPFKAIGNEGKTVTHVHLAHEGWLDLPGGHQKLCYNEIPTKVNWHYVRFDYDLDAMKALHFQCNDRIFDVSAYKSIRIPAMRNLWCMLNLFFFVETDVDKRAMAYLDGVCLSGEF